MLLKDKFVLIVLCLIELEMNQCTGQTAKNIKFRKQEELRANSEKMKKLIIKNDKMSARQNLIKLKDKKQQGTTQYPNALRQGNLKHIPRVTKMDMFQDYSDPTPPSAFADNYISRTFSSYNLKQQLTSIAQEIPNANITIEVIGRTLEYQDILMLRISENTGHRYFRADDQKYAEELPEKKIIFIVHGLKVMGMRDIPCLSTTGSFRVLLSYYTSHLDKFNIFLIPMANPDGYTYIRSTYNEFWDKNVAPQSDCPGVALDRNFDVAWSPNRTISSCSQEYPGEVPFSEAETRAVRDIFHKYGHKIVAFFNVHAGSYHSSVFRGDAVLYPKGYSDTAIDDDKYIDLKGEIDEVIRNASFQVYSVTVDTLYNWYGLVKGSSVDYASTVYGIPYSMELVMQGYDEEGNYYDEDYSYLALNEVWSKVIDVIMSYIWKSIHGNDTK
ncbi:carboxypeptidase B-like isoform X2 [Danaus plexippus]|uniref:carboxypeptidase B-like isoform X2 n=1 Tax=Danaus plexippus TaxID=13037 RepID=UPI002AAF0DA0|nr:carboxypeptidase B-like isoform X2 [Danaus plexippus]